VVKDVASKVEVNYLLYTHDEPPAVIRIKTSGYKTSAKDILEKLQDSTQADSVNSNQYKFRLNVELDTGDERYNFVNTLMWIGSGCLRGGESES
jgi:Protein of unknown function (DUF3237)